MASLCPHVFKQYLDDNGVPLAGGWIVSKAAGTSDDKNTYDSVAGDNANDNPVIFNSAGRTKIWLEEGSYDFFMYNSAGVLIDQELAVPGSTGAGVASLQTVASIAELRTLPSGSSAYVDVANYYEEGGDNGGRRVIWKDGPHPGDDNGVNFRPDNLPTEGYWQNENTNVITPATFGSKNMTVDATYDNAVHIQEAIDYMAARGGGALLVDDMYAVLAVGPHGTDGSLKNKENVSIIGLGYQTGITQLGAAPVSRKVFEQANSSVAQKNMKWDNFRISGPGSGANDNTAHAIDGWDMKDSYITNMTFEDIRGDGVYLNRNSGVVVRNAFCRDCSRQGVAVVEGSNYTVEHIRGENTGSSTMVSLVDIEPNETTPQTYIVGLTVRDVEMLDSNTIGFKIFMKSSIAETDIIQDLIIDGVKTEKFSMQRVKNGTVSNVVARASDNSDVAFDLFVMEGVHFSNITIETPAAYTSSTGSRVKLSGFDSCSMTGLSSEGGAAIAFDVFGANESNFSNMSVKDYDAIGFYIRDSTHLTFNHINSNGDGANSAFYLSKSVVDSTNIRFENVIADGCTDALTTAVGDFTDITFKGDFTGCTNEINVDSGTLAFNEDSSVGKRTAWIPTLYVGSDDDTKFTYDSRTGNYVVIGNLVMFEGEIDLATNTGGAVQVYMKIPTADQTPSKNIVATALSGEMGAHITIDTQSDFTNMFLCNPNSPSDKLNFLDKTTGTALNANAITATNVFRFSGWYLTN